MKIYRKAIPHMFIVAVITGWLSACGGGGNGGSDTPPNNVSAASINFPTDLSSTSADRITVTGKATNAEGNAVVKVSVNGVAAESITADFSSWTATIPLQAGNNHITVATEDNQGNVDNNAANNRLLVVDRVSAFSTDTDSVIAVALPGGELSDFSSAAVGAGPVFSNFAGIVVEGSRALVISGGSGGASGSYLTAVDLATGDRTILASSEDDTIGSGPELTSPMAIALTDDGSAARVVDLGDADTLTPRIISIDFPSLERKVISTAGPSPVGTGDAFSFGFPFAIAVDNASNRSLIVGSYQASIFSVADTNGDRGVFSSGSVGAGTGEPFTNPIDIA